LGGHGADLFKTACVAQCHDHGHEATGDSSPSLSHKNATVDFKGISIGIRKLSCFHNRKG